MTYKEGEVGIPWRIRGQSVCTQPASANCTSAIASRMESRSAG